jgi:hypothetical protein
MPTSVRFFTKLPLNHTFRLKQACGFLQKVAFPALHPDLPCKLWRLWGFLNVLTPLEFRMLKKYPMES